MRPHRQGGGGERVREREKERERERRENSHIANKQNRDCYAKRGRYVCVFMYNA